MWGCMLYVCVPGSNCVNVFLGLGIPWVLSAMYHLAKGTDFRVQSDNLTQSVIVFSSVGALCIIILLLRRKVWLSVSEILGPLMYSIRAVCKVVKHTLTFKEWLKNHPGTATKSVQDLFRQDCTLNLNLNLILSRLAGKVINILASHQWSAISALEMSSVLVSPHRPQKHLSLSQWERFLRDCCNFNCWRIDIA